MANVLVGGTVILTMLALGFKMTTAQVLGAFKDVKVLLIALIANVIIIPIAVAAILYYVPVDSDIKVGILILAIMPGSSLTPKFVQMAKGNAPQSIALMVSLIVFSTITVPITLALLPGDYGSAFNPITVLMTLVFVQILPLAIALFVHGRWPETAAKLEPETSKVSTYLLLIAILIIIGLNLSNIISLGWLTIGVILAIVIGTFIIGWLLGGSDKSTMALATAENNSGPALLVAGAVSALAQTATIVYALIMIAMLIAIASEIGKKMSGSGAKQPAADA